MNSAESAGGQRLIAIDWIRGFVMLLMAVDHASVMFNAGRVAADSAYLMDPSTGTPIWIPGTAMGDAQFFTRWVTHLCAPTFLFLSGTSLALSLEKRARAGESPHSLDRHLLIRGLVILACEALLSLLAGQGMAILQVLFAIGMSLLAMIPLRRLPTAWLLGGGLGWLCVGEWVTRGLVPIGSTEVPAGLALTLAPVNGDPLMVIYPFVHWLAMLLVGWAFGRHLLDLPAGNTGRRRAERTLWRGGFAALAVFFIVRGIDAYGNMGLHRDDASLIQWLHVSKYPPALAFATLELGIMALCLAGMSVFERRQSSPPWRWNPLLVLGQTALFFYMLHFLLLGAAALQLTGGFMQHGLAEAYAAAAAVIVVLYPVCCLYRGYKRAHPKSIAQYI